MKFPVAWSRPAIPVWLLLFASFQWATPVTAQDTFIFEREVRPILVEHCFPCHGPEKQKSDLRLDSEAGMLKGGSRGPVVTLGQEDSLLLQAIEYDGDPKMPPDGRLPQAQIDLLTQWVRSGAVWPSYEDTGNDTQALHWAYTPLLAVTPPEVHEASWPKGEIDRFVLARIEEAGLHPAAAADKRTLIRRATFDLIGLPPTPDEVDAFLSDDSPEDFTKVVDRLLASPQYGERWGRHWLDVVRYTDSFDSRGSPQTDPVEIWRYRDWIVQAFNEDMPYDEFLKYQIAGDLIPAPDGGFNRDGLIATGMLAIGNWPQGDADKEKMVSDIVDDQIDIVTRGFLGVTLACARCHDHKFDPFTAEDYYAMAGIFFSSSILPGPGQKTEGSPILHLPLASKEEVEERAARDKHMAAITAERDRLVAEERGTWAQAETAKTARYLLAAYASANADSATPDEDLHPEVVARWRRLLGIGGLPVMKTIEQDVQGMPGLHARRGAVGLPSAVANTTDHEVKYSTITQPAHALLLHPSPTVTAQAAWRSPIEGKVRIEGRVKDADANCGNGVLWRLDLHERGRVSSVAEGACANGGDSMIAPVDVVSVHPGSFLVLTILPNGSDHSCDSTVLELRAISEAGESWDLAADVLPRFTEGNPWPDTAGRPEVWWLASGGEDLQPDPEVFAPWWQALDEIEAGSRSPESLEEAAAEIQTRIEALASVAESSVYAALLGESGPFWLDVPPAKEDSPRVAVQAELQALVSDPLPALEYAVGIQEGGVPNTEHASIHDVRIHMRGDYSHLGDLVPRRMPIVLAGDHQPEIGEDSGRLELAEWLASRNVPLTARVMVNRIWMHHFGEALVRTPGDFGKQGEAPTHPELLDNLSRVFIDSGWSVKAMHRALMGSATYQQASQADAATLEKDPGNRLVTRMNRKRLEAEALRDSVLFVSGRLDLAQGGPAYTDLNTPRRTIYLRTVRSDRTTYPMLFDGADPTSIVPKRNEATVAPQALFLMNHPFVLAEAEALAGQMRPLENDPRAMVDALYQRLYARPASNAEIELAKDWIKELSAYIQVLLSANEFLYVD